MIHCDKCKTVNPPDQPQCRNCHRNLLPGTGAGIRLFGLIFSLVIAAFAVWVLYRMYQGVAMPDLGCMFTSPVFWGLVAIITPISGLVFALGKTPMHERYLELDDAARDLLGEAGFDPVYGARPLKRAIQHQLENPLAQSILRGDFAPGDKIRVTARDGRLAFEKGGAATV